MTNGIVMPNATPAAVIGNTGGGVSIQALIQSGIPAEWIQVQTALGARIVDLPKIWKDSQAALAGKTAMQSQPAAKPEPPKAAPYVSKAVSDASKRTFASPVVDKPAPNGETLEQELARLKAENERLKAKKSTISFKVSEATGALSVYGLGRFPVTLYREQWERLLADATVLSLFEFIEEHAGELKVKS